MIGPLIAAIGFALFSVPGVGDRYWKAFFPAIIGLGFGMAVTVAPLTTVVMNSVEEDRAGSASGINNAVARVAGVLAVAVLGIVMVKAFGFRLDRSLAGLPLPSYARQEVQANETKLAGLRLPAGLDPGADAAINLSVKDSFVYGFRIVMAICAGLSLASAGVAWLMIPPEHDRHRVPEDPAT